MNDSSGYAVFFFPNALDALGEAIKPYLQEGPLGPHVACREIDTGGAFVEMTIEGQAADGRKVALALMVPGNMVRMIVSAHGDSEFGFHARSKPAMLEPGMAASDAQPAGVVAENDAKDAPKS